MTRRAARFLTRLYPSVWRARYGEEFQAFLEARRVPPIEILNVLASALSERLAGSLAIIVYVCLALIAGGGGLYLTARGAPVIQTVGLHRVLWLCWSLVEAGSLVIVAAGAAVAAPVVFATLRRPRRDVLRKLVRPAGSGLLLILWMWVAGGAIWKSWVSAWVALLLLGGFSEAVAGFLRHLIAHSELAQSLGRLKLAVLAMAASIVVTTIMAAGWGFVANIYTDAFLGWGQYVWWSVVATVLCGAAISGTLSARRLFAGRME